MPTMPGRTSPIGICAAAPDSTVERNSTAVAATETTTRQSTVRREGMGHFDTDPWRLVWSEPSMPQSFGLNQTRIRPVAACNRVIAAAWWWYWGQTEEASALA